MRRRRVWRGRAPDMGAYVQVVIWSSSGGVSRMRSVAFVLIFHWRGGIAWPI